MQVKYCFAFLIVCLSGGVNFAQNGNGISLAGSSALSMRCQKDSGQKAKTIGAVKWKFKTGGKIFSSPVLYNDIAFVGSGDGNLYAVDVNSGKQRWKFKTGGAVHSSPALYGNEVYFGSLDGYYYAVDFTSGKLQWKFKTGGEKVKGDTAYWGMKPVGMYMDDLWDYFLSSPVIGNKKDKQTVYFGSSDGNLYAVHAEDGSLKWKFTTGGSIHATPVLANGMLYFGSWDTFFYAIDAQTGKEKWKYKTGDQVAMSGILASATVADSTVYFGARDAQFYALNAINGHLRWKYDAQGSWIISTVAVKDQVLYVGTSDSFLLLALDIISGKELFRFKTTGYVFGSPAVSGNTAYVGDFTGHLYALDLASGGKQWSVFSTDARKENAPTFLKNDTLNFMHAAKGADLSFYRENQKVMDDFFKLGPIVSSPALKNNVLYFGSADGYLYAMDLK